MPHPRPGKSLTSAGTNANKQLGDLATGGFWNDSDVWDCSVVGPCTRDAGPGSSGPEHARRCVARRRGRCGCRRRDRRRPWCGDRRRARSGDGGCDRCRWRAAPRRLLLVSRWLLHPALRRCLAARRSALLLLSQVSETSFERRPRGASFRLCDLHQPFVHACPPCWSERRSSNSMSLTSSSQSRNLSIRYPGLNIKRIVPQFASAVLTIIDPSFDDELPLPSTFSRMG